MGSNSYDAKMRFAYGTGSANSYANWGYKANSDGNKIFLSIANGGSAADILVAQADGNVGIGTTSPNSTLEVNSSSANVAAIRIGRQTTEPQCFLLGTTGGDSVIQAKGAGGVHSKLIFQRNNGSTTAESMRIDSNGKVGIGTSSPASWSQLHVAAAAGGDQTGADQALYVQAPTATNGHGVGIRLSAASGSREAVGIISMVNNASGNAGSMAFHTYNLGASIPEQMRLTNEGRLGIGTTSPTANLTITDENAGQATIHARNFATSATGSFGNQHAFEFRAASSTTTHGMLVLAQHHQM